MLSNLKIQFPAKVHVIVIGLIGFLCLLSFVLLVIDWGGQVDTEEILHVLQDKNRLFLMEMDLVELYKFKAGDAVFVGEFYGTARASTTIDIGRDVNITTRKIEVRLPVPQVTVERHDDRYRKVAYIGLRMSPADEMELLDEITERMHASAQAAGIVDKAKEQAIHLLTPLGAQFGRTVEVSFYERKDVS